MIKKGGWALLKYIYLHLMGQHFDNLSGLLRRRKTCLPHSISENTERVSSKIHDIRKRKKLYSPPTLPGIFMEQKWNVHAKYFSFNDDMPCPVNTAAWPRGTFLAR